jgi:hypothetical protein
MKERGREGGGNSTSPSSLIYSILIEPRGRKIRNLVFKLQMNFSTLQFGGVVLHELLPLQKGFE